MSGTAEGAGGVHGHSSGSMSGAFDLLKQATQRMMSKDSPRYVIHGFCFLWLPFRSPPLHLPTLSRTPAALARLFYATAIALSCCTCFLLDMSSRKRSPTGAGHGPGFHGFHGFSRPLSLLRTGFWGASRKRRLMAFSQCRPGMRKRHPKLAPRCISPLQGSRT